MQQADKAEAEKILKKAIYWYDKNVAPFCIERYYNEINWLETYCKQICQYMKDNFGIILELIETTEPLNKNIKIIDCSSENLVMLKLVIS